MVLRIIKCSTEVWYIISGGSVGFVVEEKL
jgi:hypothetical protein